MYTRQRIYYYNTTSSCVLCVKKTLFYDEILIKYSARINYETDKII